MAGPCIWILFLNPFTGILETIGFLFCFVFFLNPKMQGILQGHPVYLPVSGTT